MIPVLFKLGPITVYSYGMMMVLGFLAADFVISSECRRRGLNRDFASSLVVWAGIACSRLYAVIDKLRRLRARSVVDHFLERRLRMVWRLDR
jgi:phosphatidylglycerol---prolipoprotein diacylglyceryl transferase